MLRVTTPTGIEVSYVREGAGPPLVLVHGSFSDHRTNWMYVHEALRERFTLYAIARRGRGDTSATSGHAIVDEAADVAAVIDAIGAPVFLLGHSYGAVCALEAALLVPERVAKLVIYEPPWTERASAVLPRLEPLAARADWDGLVETFLRDFIGAPREEIEALQRSPDWATWIADAPATMADVHALARYRVDVERFRALAMPTLVLFGTESVRERYLTDALARALPEVRVVGLEGQAHEGMTTAPAMFVEKVEAFLCGDHEGRNSRARARGTNTNTNTGSRRA